MAYFYRIFSSSQSFLLKNCIPLLTQHTFNHTTVYSINMATQRLSSMLSHLTPTKTGVAAM